MIRALVLAVFLVGCGVPPCADSDRVCAGRCVSVCVDGEWQAPKCLPCGSFLVDPSGRYCSVPPLACVEPTRR
jgi:hypothetical protein